MSVETLIPLPVPALSAQPVGLASWDAASEQRWNTWRLRGQARDLAFRRKLKVVLGLFAGAAAVVVAFWEIVMVPR